MNSIKDYCLEINFIIMGLQEIEATRPDLFDKYIEALWEERHRIIGT